MKNIKSIVCVLVKFVNTIYKISSLPMNVKIKEFKGVKNQTGILKIRNVYLKVNDT